MRKFTWREGGLNSHLREQKLCCRAWNAVQPALVIHKRVRIVYPDANLVINVPFEVAEDRAKLLEQFQFIDAIV